MHTRGWLITAMTALICAVALWLSLSKGTAEEEAQIIAPTDKDTCLACHAEKIDQKHLEASAHGRLSCQVCHAGIDQFPHPEKAVKTKPKCDNCHSIKSSEVTGSVHRSVANKPGAKFTCQMCHGKDAHNIAEVSKISHDQQMAPCNTCHRQIAATLGASVHAKNGHEISGERPNCISCHSGDPHAIASVKSVPVPDAKCRNCHTDIARMQAGSAHGQLGEGKAKPLTCNDCHGSAHAVQKPAQGGVQAKAALCEKCHTDEVGMLNAGAHRHVRGKKTPDCLSCHGNNIHAVQPRTLLSMQRDASCRECHRDVVANLAGSVHGHALAPSQKIPDCLACHGDSAHRVLPLKEMKRDQQERACKSCHQQLSHSLKNSVHDRPDKKAGDHPTCESCHGASAHTITPPKHLTPKQKAELCGECHSDADRMARYGLTTAAYSSYADTFHGKALLRFGKKDSANCTDCHGLHGVLSPEDPNSPTNPKHVAATCGKCHPGSKLNFALSGANHLRSRIESSPVLKLEETLFRLLILGSMSALFGMVLIDLRRKVFASDSNPERGRVVGMFISFAFFALTAGIILAFIAVPKADGGPGIVLASMKILGITLAGWSWIAALTCMVAAFIAYKIQLLRNPHHKIEKHYPRMTKVMRLQHFLLAFSFTMLVLTGFPLHFTEVDWVRGIIFIFGGLDSARIIHRICGVMLIANWLWHLSYLLLLWKRAGFSFKSWNMFPSWKDVTDFFDTVSWGLGIRKEPPAFGRFQFREKFDYFADMWGTIVMGVSGMIMWFPTTIGNRLPDLAFGASYIAHSYEGLLAMMAIIVWHLYNVHFNPDVFPMNPAWLTGTLSETEMEREHPLEKMEIDKMTTGDRDKTPTLH